MVQGVPYVHWKIKDAVDLTEIDPVYLWGTVVETDKGPLDTPVFVTNADQAKKIFNINLEPYFANGGRAAVIVRAYGGQPAYSNFSFTLDQPFSYAYVDYDYYDVEETSIKAVVNVTSASENTERPIVTKEKTGIATLNVAFSEGRWRVCDANGKIIHYYHTTEKQGTGDDAQDVPVIKVAAEVTTNGLTTYHIEGTTSSTAVMKKDATSANPATEIDTFTKAFNESDVTKTIIAKQAKVETGAEVLKVQAIYPGDFSIPISVLLDARSGYRVSITESDEYTIMISGATTLDYLEKRINERATNITAKLTSEGEMVQKPFSTKLVTAIADDEGTLLPELAEDGSNISAYTAAVQARKLPVGSIFAKPDGTSYKFVLAETVTNLADGSNGAWDTNLHRIVESERVQAHKDALDLLAKIKLSGIFCMYGEDDIQKVYTDHVSTTEPQGMNSSEVCKWRSLIVGANSLDRTNDYGDPGFNLMDKAAAFDNENILFLGQGLIDSGYVPESNVQLLTDDDGNAILNAANQRQYVPLLHKDNRMLKGYDEGALLGQLLPFQCTQYVAGLRSKLFYGDAIFGGETKKAIVGIGPDFGIAPLFAGENKVLWQPDNYVALNQAGVLTFTDDYNLPVTLMDGVTTRQSPLEEDEEGVQSIVKYAKHAVHEVLQSFIGRNITGDLEAMMENAATTVLNTMTSTDQTLVAVASEGLAAFDVDIVLVPKSNAQQTLAKAYVYLKLTPVHALRQIETELTVQ